LDILNSKEVHNGANVMASRPANRKCFGGLHRWRIIRQQSLPDLHFLRRRCLHRRLFELKKLGDESRVSVLQLSRQCSGARREERCDALEDVRHARQRGERPYSGGAVATPAIIPSGVRSSSAPGTTTPFLQMWSLARTQLLRGLHRIRRFLRRALGLD